jgi:dimethylglycine dehydrogenase
VKPDYANIGNELFIEIQGEKIKAKIIDEPTFDKNNNRLKS